MAETLPVLLPVNRTPFETAQALTSAARRPLPADLIRSVWNPATCTVELLPYLAAGLGLEIWRDSWPEARKRAVVGEIWRLKRNKTKLKGLIAYLGLVDAKLLGARRPRDKRWWVRTMTDDERAAQMAGMPQIRIPAAVTPIAASLAKAFWRRGGKGTAGAWGARRVWMRSDAPARAAARATYFDRGVSTPVTLRGIEGGLGASTLVVLSAGASRAKMFWGHSAWGARASFMASDAGSHLLAITPREDAPSFAVPTGLEPVAVRPVRVNAAAPGRPGQGLWAGEGPVRAAWGRFAWRNSDAAAQVFDQITLFDPRRTVPTRQPYSFWGVSHWGRPAFTAEIKIDVTLTRPPGQHGWGKPWGRGFWARSDMTPFWDAVASVRTSTATRDTLWIDTRLAAPVVFSAGLRFGDADFPTFGAQRTLL